VISKADAGEEARLAEEAQLADNTLPSVSVPNGVNPFSPSAPAEQVGDQNLNSDEDETAAQISH
jgi:hypothetical protein